MFQARSKLPLFVRSSSWLLVLIFSIFQIISLIFFYCYLAVCEKFSNFNSKCFIEVKSISSKGLKYFEGRKLPFVSADKMRETLSQRGAFFERRSSFKKIYFFFLLKLKRRVAVANLLQNYVSCFSRQTQWSPFFWAHEQKKYDCFQIFFAVDYASELQCF